jgi:hypothetical protein
VKLSNLVFLFLYLSPIKKSRTRPQHTAVISANDNVLIQYMRNSELQYTVILICSSCGVRKTSDPNIYWNSKRERARERERERERETSPTVWYFVPNTSRHVTTSKGWILSNAAGKTFISQYSSLARIKPTSLHHVWSRRAEESQNKHNTVLTFITINSGFFCLELHAVIPFEYRENTKSQTHICTRNTKRRVKHARVSF